MVMTAPLKSVVYGAMNLELPTVYNLNDPPRSRFARKRAAIREDDGPQVKVSCSNCRQYTTLDHVEKIPEVHDYGLPLDKKGGGRASSSALLLLESRHSCPVTTNDGSATISLIWLTHTHPSVQ